MTVRQMVEALRGQGYAVKTRERTSKEGKGLRIVKIDGQSFQGSAGNIYARTLLGQELSSVQRRHLATVAPQKGEFGTTKRNLLDVEESTKRRIKRIQAKFRRRGLKQGVPTIRNYRYNLQEFGKEEAERLLEASERYVVGLAYKRNIEALIERLDNDLTIKPNEDVRAARDIIYNYNLEGAPNFLDSELMDIYQLLYAWEQSGRPERAKELRMFVEALDDIWRRA